MIPCTLWILSFGVIEPYHSDSVYCIMYILAKSSISKIRVLHCLSSYLSSIYILSPFFRDFSFGNLINLDSCKFGFMIKYSSLQLDFFLYYQLYITHNPFFVFPENIYCFSNNICTINKY